MRRKRCTVGLTTKFCTRSSRVSTTFWFPDPPCWFPPSSLPSLLPSPFNPAPTRSSVLFCYEVTSSLPGRHGERRPSVLPCPFLLDLPNRDPLKVHSSRPLPSSAPECLMFSRTLNPTPREGWLDGRVFPERWTSVGGSSPTTEKDHTETSWVLVTDGRINK